MADHTPQVFTGITPSKFANLEQQARAAGIDMNGPSGRASKMGIEIEWNYSEQTQELVLTCLKTPAFVSADQVNTKMRSLVNQVLAS
jgi:hypothetical protein